MDYQRISYRYVHACLFKSDMQVQCKVAYVDVYACVVDACKLMCVLHVGAWFEGFVEHAVV